MDCSHIFCLYLVVIVSSALVGFIVVTVIFHGGYCR